MSLKKKFCCRTLGCKMGYTVKGIMRMLENEFEKASVQLTIEQYFLLNILNSEEGLILKELAETVDRDKSAVLRHINSLEKNQFVARATDPSDKRRKVIYITRPGMRALKEAQELDKQIDNKISRSVSDKELKVFENVLSDLYGSVTL